jgi:hypothetical protein
MRVLWPSSLLFVPFKNGRHDLADILPVRAIIALEVELTSGCQGAMQQP